jgi:hypothetical protein
MRAGKLSPRGNVVRRLATPRPSSIFLLDHLAEHFNRGGECPLSVMWTQRGCPTRPDKGDRSGSSLPARRSCFQIDPTRRHRLETVRGVPTFRPARHPCRSPLRARALSDQSQSRRTSTGQSPVSTSPKYRPLVPWVSNTWIPPTIRVTRRLTPTT